jgi:hypothetical protein
MGLRRRTKSGQQSRQAGPIFVSNDSKLQSHPTGVFDVARYGLGSDLPFFHKEIDLRGGADGLRLRVSTNIPPKLRFRTRKRSSFRRSSSTLELRALLRERSSCGSSVALEMVSAYGRRSHCNETAGWSLTVYRTPRRCERPCLRHSCHATWMSSFCRLWTLWS